MKKTVLFTALVAATTLGANCFAAETPTNFVECEQMGGAIMESYPRQCALGDLHFTEEVENMQPILITPTSLEIEDENVLSENDQNFYEHIKSTLSEKAQDRVYRNFDGYLERITDLSKNQKESLNNRLIEKTDMYIHQILMKYPQDVALPEKANRHYLALKLVKFELMQLEF